MTSSFLFQLPQLYREKTVHIALGVSVFGSCILVAFFGMMFFLSNRKAEELQIIDPTSQEITSPQDSSFKDVAEECCFVEISGAVHLPGVYQVQPEGRVKDVIVMAGGFAEKADTAYIAKDINLAKKVDDQEKIYIPYFQKNNPNESVKSPEKIGKISINSASQKELEDLPGVGEVTAEKIIASRPYTSIDDFFKKVKLSSKQQIELRELISF